MGRPSIPVQRDTASAAALLRRLREHDSAQVALANALHPEGN